MRGTYGVGRGFYPSVMETGKELLCVCGHIVKFCSLYFSTSSFNLSSPFFDLKKYIYFFCSC